MVPSNGEWELGTKTLLSKENKFHRRDRMVSSNGEWNWEGKRY
jgi:hypothetical protein